MPLKLKLYLQISLKPFLIILTVFLLAIFTPVQELREFLKLQVQKLFAVLMIYLMHLLTVVVATKHTVFSVQTRQPKTR